MRSLLIYFGLVFIFLFSSCGKKERNSDKSVPFPDELVNFHLLKQDAVFGGTGNATWDKLIRERGFIIKVDDEWRLYYSGYNPDSSNVKYLGLAISKDGIEWTRYSKRPIYREDWVEDMFVLKYDGLYYMFAEGENDIPHWLTSADGIKWRNEGNLKILKTDGKTAVGGRVGTPTVWIEDGIWYLYYERGDQGIWLAKSKDAKQWINVSDEPVIPMGPDKYDKYAVATNCMIKYNGRYYTYYHAAADSIWNKWTVNVAMSTDLIHWTKYEKNPIIGPDHSSPVVIYDGSQFRLYTMHPVVHIYVSKK